MSKLDAVFTDAFLDECTANITELNSMLIENCAQVAYNTVLFESAVETLSEAEDEEKKDSKFSAVKNAAFKALDTLKRVAKVVFEKIKNAINQFIAKVSSKSAAAWVKQYQKEKNEDDWSQSKVKPAKYLAIADPDKVFPLDMGIGEMMRFDTEEAMVAALVKKIQVPANYAAAKKALGEAKTVADVNKVIGNFASFAEENKNVYTAEEVLNALPEMKKTFADLKASYKKAVDACNAGIKNTYTQLNAASDEEVPAIKNEIAMAQKLMGFFHAAYAGYMKYILALNASTIAAIRSAKKGGVQEAVEEPQLETFMGLALL